MKGGDFLKSSHKNKPRFNDRADQRRRELALIHIGKKQLCLDETTYREMLIDVSGHNSARGLDHSGRLSVIRRLEQLGFKPQMNHRGLRPHASPQEDRAPFISKIGAILHDLGLEWGYADGIARKMFGVDRVVWLKPTELQKVMVALIYHQKRCADADPGKHPPHQHNQRTKKMC